MRPGLDPVAPLDLDRFKFFFLWRDDPDSRWRRDATPVYEFTDFDAAYDQFWLDVDRANLLYAGCVNGDLPDESDDQWAYGDQFIPTGEYTATRARLAAQPEVDSWFTVFGVWDSGDGWRRNVEHVWAKSAFHAELDWRDLRLGYGQVMVAAVVAGRRLGIEYPGRLYATRRGKPPGSPEETELDWVEAATHRRRWWRRS